jgi:hypothetical protein
MTDTPTPPVGGAGQVPVLSDPPSEPREPAAGGSGMVGDPEGALRPAEAAQEPWPGYQRQAEEFSRMHAKMVALHKGMEAGYQSAQEDLGRSLDPVRAHALAQAVRALPWLGDVPRSPERVVAIAERFETWLARDEGGR